MSNRIPEAFYIYQELIRKLAYQKAQLQLQYESQIDKLTNEVSMLVNTIESQNKRLEESKNYIEALEERLNNYKKAC